MQSVTVLQRDELLSLYNVKDNLATLTGLLEEYILFIQQPCTETLSDSSSKSVGDAQLFFTFGCLTWTSYVITSHCTVHCASAYYE